LQCIVSSLIGGVSRRDDATCGGRIDSILLQVLLLGSSSVLQISLAPHLPAGADADEESDYRHCYDDQGNAKVLVHALIVMDAAEACALATRRRREDAAVYILGGIEWTPQNRRIVYVGEVAQSVRA